MAAAQRYSRIGSPLGRIGTGLRQTKGGPQTIDFTGAQLGMGWCAPVSGDHHACTNPW